MTGCSALHCSNRNNQGFTLVTFPTDPVRREKWRKATGRNDWIPKTTNSLCEVHFLPEDWVKFKVRLKADAVPSIFCNCQQENVDPAAPRTKPAEHSYATDTPKEVPKRKVLGDISSEHNYVNSRQKSSKVPKKKKVDHHSSCPIVTRIIGDRQFPDDTNISANLSSQEPPAATDTYEENSCRNERTVEPLPPQGVTEAVRNQEVVVVPAEYLLKLEAANAQLEKRANSLQNQLAAVKQKRDELKAAKKELQKKSEKELKAAKKELQEEAEKHSRLSEWVHGKFSDRQIKAAMDGVTRGAKWGEEDVKTALMLKCAGGTAGLTAASELLMPLPSPRTVRRKIAHIKFEPGIQHDILDKFAGVVEALKLKKDIFADCLLFFDDMSIKTGVQFDKGSDHYIGHCTLPGVCGVASKVQCYMFGGVAENWKILGAYHLVLSTSHPEASKATVVELLIKGKAIGLNVLGIVCDMGNRPLLKALGFETTKGRIVYAIPNPADPTKPLYCIPDMVHVFKSIKEMLGNNREINLPPDVVQEYQLPSPTVQVAHIEKLCKFQEHEELKLHPRLSENDVHSNHFNKMKVAPATHVLSEKTATALQFLVEHEPEEFSRGCITTAWFCMLLQKWFKIVTSRRRKLALSLHNLDAYNEAISLLRLVIRVFQGMQVPGGWKPSQTHLIMATSSILELTKYLLVERRYDFVLLGRFLQDIVENLFSLVRLSRPNPTALEVKYRLRQIVISQCSQYVPNSSYHRDDRVDVLDNLLQRPEETSQQNLSAPRQFNWIDPPEDFLTTVEENVLYRMCGYVVKTLIDSNQIKCEECLKSLKTSDRHPASLWTLLTNFRENAQVQVSEEVFHLCKSVEYNLRRWKPIIQNLKTSFTEALEEPLKQIESSLPTCHSVTYLLLKRFSSMRLKQMLKTSEVTKAAPSDGTQFGSKSMGSRFLADNYKR